MNGFRVLAAATTFLISGSALTGCGESPALKENAELKVRVAALETENLVLKAKAAGMQKEVAAAPTEATATPEPERHLFIDLEEVPQKDMIDDLNTLHVFDESEDKFGPYRPITRGEYVTWLYKAYNAMEPPAKKMRPAPQLAQVFTDLPATHPAFEYVQAVSNAGYSIGYKDGTFRPDRPLTREEMLGIKVGVDVGKDLPPWRSQMETVWKFSDGKDVDERFTGYVHQDFYVSGPQGSNIQRAFGKIGKFAPKQSVTRSEAASTLWQFGQFGDTQRINAAEAGKTSHG